MMPEFEPFTRLQRAVTLAGMAPFALIGAAAHPATAPGGPAQAWVQVPPPAQPIAAPRALTATINHLVDNFAGVVGVSVTSIDDGWTAHRNGDLKLPQQSVSKLWVAMAALDAVDRGQVTLEDRVVIRRSDLTLFHQPIAALVGDNGYETSIGELLRRAMTVSDNTCNDRVLRHIGGPEAVRAFFSNKAIADVRFGPGERLLQSRTAGLTWTQDLALGNAFALARARLPYSVRLAAFEAYVADPPDGAAPTGITEALARLKRGELLSPRSTAWLMATMGESRTGRMRLRGAVPPGWQFGHKTGTGQNLQGRTAGYNDVGILTAPDGKSYAIAVMIGDTLRPVPERQDLMQAVVAAIVANHR